MTSYSDIWATLKALVRSGSADGREDVRRYLLTRIDEMAQAAVDTDDHIVLLRGQVIGPRTTRRTALTAARGIARSNPHDAVLVVRVIGLTPDGLHVVHGSPPPPPDEEMHNPR